MKPDRPQTNAPRRRLLLRRVLAVLAVLYLTASIVGGIGLGWIAVHPPRNPISAREQKNVEATARHDSDYFQDLTLPAWDGTILKAWFLRPSSYNGNAVVLFHGVSDNRLAMYGYGKWLLTKGYAVLLPDARGHGLSGGLASYGLKESDDIHLWVDWIEQNDHPQCVFGLGESMGAAQLLQSLAQESRFCGVVAESPFATFREVAYARFGREFHTGPWLGRTFFRPTVDVGFLYVRLAYGFNMEEASPERAVAHTQTPVLLIHGLMDRNIPPYHSADIQAQNPSDVSLWKVRGAVHTGAHKTDPVEFEHRVLDWFTSHSSTSATQAPPQPAAFSSQPTVRPLQTLIYAAL